MGWNRICETCGLPVPDPSKVIKGMNVPCSSSHTRCIRCGWPFATALAEEDCPDLCRQCRGKK